jgi:phosphoribosylaminoimidazole-succinocarboxamide synthase
LVKKELWEKVEKAALALFARGQEIAGKNGLILVDTKYEMGLIGDELVLIDEVHTPDSSRFWFKDTYQPLFEAGKDQRKLDKEYLRQWLMERGFSGDGDAPNIPDEVRLEVAYRYIEAFEIITGTEFVPSPLSGEEETRAVLALAAQR